MADIQIDLFGDWIQTVKEIFKGSGIPLPAHISDSEASLIYFMQTAKDEAEARTLGAQNEERLRGLQAIVLANFESVILPDIRSRTGYGGNRFEFQWIYNYGEHIIEKQSSYRIPL